MLLDDTGNVEFLDLSDDELLDRLDRLAQLSSMVAATRLGLLREADVRDIAGLDGHSSTGVWLAHRHHISRGKASGDLRLGRALLSMPVVSEAFRAGEISEAHVRLLVDLCKPAIAGLFARDEQMLVDKALELSFKDFRYALRYWALRADPDDGDDNNKRSHDERKAHMSQVGNSWYLDARFNLTDGAAVAEALERIEKEFFDRDWAKAKEAHGDDVYLGDLERTPRQRRADALVEIMRRSTATAPGAKPVEPLVVITIDHETFTAEAMRLIDRVTPSPAQPFAPAPQRRCVLHRH